MSTGKDRLAALRAQRQHQPVLLTSIQSPAYTSSPASAAETALDTPAFLAEDASMQQGIQHLRNNIVRLAEFRLQCDNAIDTKSHEEIDSLTNEAKAMSQDLKRRIQLLGNQQMFQDVELRKGQIRLLRSKFVEALQEYQCEEQEGKQRLTQSMERQIKIVKPDATPLELAAVIQGGDDLLFAEAVTNSLTRYEESRSGYPEVEECQREIRRVDQTLAELAQVFKEMAAMAEDDDRLDDHKADAELGSITCEAPLVNVAYRRKRWICCGIILLTICTIIALAIGLYFGVGPGKAK